MPAELAKYIRENLIFDNQIDEKVLLAVAEAASEKGICALWIESIAELSGLNVIDTQRSLNRLQHRGFIRKNIIRSKNHDSNHCGYVILVVRSIHFDLPPINEEKEKEWGLNRSQSFIFSFFYHVTDQGRLNGSYSLPQLMESLSYISNKRDTFRRHVYVLEKKGLISVTKTTRSSGWVPKPFTITDKGMEWGDFS